MLPLAAKVALAPLLAAQGVWTRRRVPVLAEADGKRSGEIGSAAGDAPLLRLLIVGDSSAAGVGVRHQDQALAGHLTRELAARTQTHLRWRLVARTGVSTAAALAMLRSTPTLQPADVAAVVTGVNDVLQQVPTRRAIAARAAMADWLRESLGVRHVAFAGLPPMHRFPALPQPLRWFAGAEAQRHDRELAAWANGRDGVSWVPITMSLAASNMAEDGFHPGEPVYRACGEQIAAHLASRLG